MAPSEGRVANSCRRWGRRRGTPNSRWRDDNKWQNNRVLPAPDVSSPLLCYRSLQASHLRRHDDAKIAEHGMPVASETAARFSICHIDQVQLPSSQFIYQKHLNIIVLHRISTTTTNDFSLNGQFFQSYSTFVNILELQHQDILQARCHTVAQPTASQIQNI